MSSVENDICRESLSRGSFPPKPDAFVTSLSSIDQIPAVQTLLYSIKKKCSFETRRYPSEVVLLHSCDDDDAIKRLCPALCTRIIPIPPKKEGQESNNKKDDDNDWSKLHIFGLTQYDTLVFIDCSRDCRLVNQDLTEKLLSSSLGYSNKRKSTTEKKDILVAATMTDQDTTATAHLDTGVMVLQPSTSMWTIIQQKQEQRLDESTTVTEFINSLFPDWDHTSRRLPSGYSHRAFSSIRVGDDNAGANRGSGSWLPDEDTFILHYDNSNEMPWMAPTNTSSGGTPTTPIEFWQDWHRRSNNYVKRYQQNEQKKMKEQQQAKADQARKRQRKEQQEQQAHAEQMLIQQQLQQQQQEQQAPRTNQASTHKQVTRRFKQLRAEGMPTQEAMKQAREEIVGSEAEEDPTLQVASMFGMR